MPQGDGKGPPAGGGRGRGRGGGRGQNRMGGQGRSGQGLGQRRQASRVDRPLGTANTETGSPGTQKQIAVVDQETCTLCGACQDVCPFDAIDFGELTAIIDAEKCGGCGACMNVCPNDAIKLT